MSFAHLSFFFDCARHKEKRYKKRNAESISLPAGSDQGSAFGNRKPLKRLDLNLKI